MPGSASAKQQETVDPAAASRLAFVTTPQTLTAGVASGTITAALEDAFGNRVSASGALTVALSTTSTKGTFSPTSPVTIPAGGSTVSFHYSDTSTGTPVLTAAIGSLTAATQQETVVPAAASHLAFTTAPQTLTAGVASNTITVALEDAFGNTVEATSPLTVTLSTTSTSGTFTPGAPSASSLTIPAGTGAVSFQ
jgi:adhesin/invasin